MITDIQKRFLMSYLDGIKTKRDDPHKHSVYMGRIRNTIDHRIENGLWLSNNMPEVLRDEEWEINELGAIQHRRLKLLLQIINGMHPESTPQLILKKEIIPSYEY